jgi:hypothetical protein
VTQPAPAASPPPAFTLLDPQVAARITELQSLDDAIASRLARLSGTCTDCPPGDRCPGHAADAGLIATYRRRHADVLAQALDGTDPALAAGIMRHDPSTPPTVLALALAVDARLRELAAHGPVITRTDLGPAVFTLEDGELIEHPLTPPDGTEDS